MNPWPDTRDTLLARLHDPADRQAWEQFSCIYEPLVYRVASRKGLQDADARDVAQQVMLAVSKAAQDWTQGNTRGRFRGWLSRVTTNATINMLQREGRHRAPGSTDVWELLQQQADESEVTQIWQQERKLELFRYAAKQVSPKFSSENWQAFWRTAIDNESIENVAKKMNKSVGAIYAARSRIMANIRKVVEQIEAEEEQQDS